MSNSFKAAQLGKRPSWDPPQVAAVQNPSLKQPGGVFAEKPVWDTEVRSKKG